MLCQHLSTLTFATIPAKYQQTTRGTTFLRKDTGPGADRLLILLYQRTTKYNGRCYGKL